MNAYIADPVYVITHVIMIICFLTVIIVPYAENALNWMRKNLIYPQVVDILIKFTLLIF